MNLKQVLLLAKEKLDERIIHIKQIDLNNYEATADYESLKKVYQFKIVDDAIVQE